MSGLRKSLIRRFLKALRRGDLKAMLFLGVTVFVLYVLILKPVKITQRLTELGVPLKPLWINPVVGRITSPFGERPSPYTDGSSIEFHNGTDIGVPIGTHILNPRDGVVSRQWSGGLGGMQLIITHDNGYKTGYAHLSGYECFLDQVVKQGDLLGYTGTGGTGAHLHLTVTDASGNKINPEEIFSFV